ncbi:MAG: (2Fe-2S)-binding protein [Deltaproteobacteria bacterium]|nr:(2Fe-2S)-binding protein [Deltaproteobacteria bacterium]
MADPKPPGDTSFPAATAVPTPPPAAEKPKVLHLKIDGVPVEAAPGTNLIEAARKVGIEIPYYCYHPKLSIAANCRMCLVETSNAPKLVPGCQTPVAEGIEVRTTTSRVKEAQRSVLEFLLLNHPVDCSICDQAGECKLQDYYMKFDHQPSRLVGPKILKEKRKVLGPLVVLDQERCILCTRCVRFMKEVAHEPQLGVFGRGSSEVIDTFPGQPLDSNYAGNTIDLGPVGALLSRDVRFKARAFFLSTTPSVCTGCARGCSTFLDYFNNETYRYRPRENPKVNDVWMCDHGRLSYKYLEHERALEVKIGRMGEGGRTAPKEEAIRLAAEKLRPLVGAEALAFAISPLGTVEDLLAGLKLAKDGLKLSRIYLSGRAPGKADHLLLREDRNPNRAAVYWIAKALGLAVEPFASLSQAIDQDKIKALYAYGAEVPTAPTLVASLLDGLSLVIVQGINLGPVAGKAHVLFPASPHSEDEGTFVNFEGHIQRAVAAYPPRGQSRPHWSWASMLLTELGVPVTWRSSREVFRELAPAVPELSGFRWDAVPRYLKHPRGIWAMPAAADGRPVGYRERSTP